jgi:hypothetical protein
MKLDRDGFSVDESKSNPMVVAMRYKDCPVDEICFFMAVGFGSIVRQCEHFESKEDAETAICNYGKVEGGT